MKYAIIITLLMLFCFNAFAVESDTGKPVAEEKDIAKSLFVSIATYSIFAISAGFVATGAIINNDKLFNVFMPLMTASVGFYLGGRF